MKLTDNNALNVLIVVNVIALLAVFTLFWVLWKNGSPVPVEKVNLGDVDESVAGIAITDAKQSSVDIVPKEKLSMSERIRLEVGSVDKLLGSNLGRNMKSEMDKEIAASSSLAEVENLSELSDIEYVIQYQKTQDEVQPERNINSENVTTVKVVKSAGESKPNEFNSIDVSGLKHRAEMLNNITSRITSLMTAKQAPEESDTVKPKAWDDYLDSIKSAEVERKNEMRTIRVKVGESLWEIAVRAYGNGFLYKKIFEANPQLTNPDLIVAGQKLRVPL